MGICQPGPHSTCATHVLRLDENEKLALSLSTRLSNRQLAIVLAVKRDRCKVSKAVMAIASLGMLGLAIFFSRLWWSYS